MTNVRVFELFSYLITLIHLKKLCFGHLLTHHLLLKHRRHLRRDSNERLLLLLLLLSLKLRDQLLQLLNLVVSDFSHALQFPKQLVAAQNVLEHVQHGGGRSGFGVVVSAVLVVRVVEVEQLLVELDLISSRRNVILDQLLNRLKLLKHLLVSLQNQRNKSN